MIGRLFVLYGGVLAFWVLIALPARALLEDGDESARVIAYCGTTLLLCMIPTTLTLWWGRRALEQSPDQQLAAVMGGTGIRLFAVLVAAWALWSNIGFYQQSSFWNWLLIAYLFTLALEITLLLMGRPTAAPKP